MTKTYEGQRVLVNAGPLFVGTVEEVVLLEDGAPLGFVAMGFQHCDGVLYRQVTLFLRRKLTLVVLRLWPVTEETMNRRIAQYRRRRGLD